MDTWRAVYAGIVPDDHLVSLSYEDSERQWRHVIGAGRRLGGVWLSEVACGWGDLDVLLARVG